MGTVMYDIAYHVQAGNEAKHTEIIKVFVAAGDKAEPDTLLYIIYEDPKEKNKWNAREVFKNEGAMLKHLDTVKDKLGPWMGTMVGGTYDSLTMVGDYSAASKEAYGPLGAHFVEKGDMGFAH